MSESRMGLSRVPDSTETPQVRKRSQRLHKGTITVEVPDTLWATDATEAWTRGEGRCAVFVLVDHASNEVW